MNRWSALVVGLAVVFAACTGTPDVVEVEPDDPSESAEGVLAVVLDALRSQDAAPIAAVTDLTQIPLLALAEGTAVRQVAGFSNSDRSAVAANFWSGFIGQLESSLGSGLRQLRSGELERSETEGVRFAAVDLVVTSSDPRRLVLRETESGWVLDLIASFASPLVGLIPDVAQTMRVFGDATLLEDLRGYEPSVRFILDDVGTNPLLDQAAIAALESVIR